MGKITLHRKDQVQEWRRVPFIEGSYRLDFSFREAFFSIMSWHNETLNIWTHLIGWALAYWWMVHSLNTWLLEGSGQDKFLFQVIMYASQLQMLCSVSHHWYGCMQRTIYLLTARLDYSAIAILLPACTSSVIYYILYCHSFPFWTYTILNASFGIAVLGLCWWPLFQTPPFQKFRAFMFSSLGLFVAFSWIHGIYLYPELLRSCSFFYQVSVGILMGIGVCIYIARFPERSQPGFVLISWIFFGFNCHFFDRNVGLLPQPFHLAHFRNFGELGILSYFSRTL